MLFLMPVFAGGGGGGGGGHVVVPVPLRRSVAGASEGNTSFVLAAERTQRRKDPLNGFRDYTGGWNISNQHYWAVSSSYIPFILFLLSTFEFRPCCRM